MARLFIFVFWGQDIQSLTFKVFLGIDIWSLLWLLLFTLGPKSIEVAVRSLGKSGSLGVTVHIGLKERLKGAPGKN